VSLGDPFAEDFVFGLEELELADQFVAGAAGEQEQQGLGTTLWGCRYASCL
jgi:hypothetical protein